MGRDDFLNRMKNEDLLDLPLNLAVLVYLGVGVGSSPIPRRERLDAYFGKAAADPLESRVRKLLEESRVLPGTSGDRGITEVALELEQRLRAEHPELSDLAIWSLLWYYTYGASR